MNEEPKSHLLSNRLYQLLNSFALVVGPALATLYFALANIWGLPYAEEVLGTTAAVDTFLGVLIKVGNASYDNSDAKYDGTMDVKIDGGGVKGYLLNLDSDPEELAAKKQISFKVNNTE